MTEIPSHLESSPDPEGYRLYAVRLKATVLEDSRFREANPDYEEGRPVIYVGMTGRSRELRFHQHLAGYKASRYVHRFGKRLFHWVHDDTGTFDRWEQAEEAEEALAEDFRARGWGVWQN